MSKATYAAAAAEALWVRGRVVASPMWRVACPRCRAAEGTSCFLGTAGGRADNGWVHAERRELLDPADLDVCPKCLGAGRIR
jgi:hypothetical protein